MGYTAVKKRMKHIVLQADSHTVQVAVSKRLKAITAGTPIVLYIAKNTSVYEKGGIHFIYAYLAIDIQAKRQIKN